MRMRRGKLVLPATLRLALFCADEHLGRERLELVWDGDDAEEASSIDAPAASATDENLGT
jgi:hypothetical protein